MPKYRVYLTRTLWQEAEIEVEAESELDAEDIALEVAEQDPDEFKTVEYIIDVDDVEELES